jgi:PilZ domain
MPSELKYPYVASRRIGKERRVSPRYPFTATCDATEPKSHAKIIGRTSDLGRGGCYIDTIGPFPPGTPLVVRINRDGLTLTIEGKVAFSQPGMGMGLSFTKAAPDQHTLLDQWIAELSGEAVETPDAVAAVVGQQEAPAKAVEGQPMFVLNELILLLLQKGVLSDTEGKALLQKLLK